MTGFAALSEHLNSIGFHISLKKSINAPINSYPHLRQEFRVCYEKYSCVICKVSISVLRESYYTIVRRALKTNKQLSEARNKQATHISETRDGPHFVASHFFIVRPILVLMNLSWLNLCLCVKPFITWIGQTIKKWLATKGDPSRISLMWVACLFRASLSCLFVFSARRVIASTSTTIFIWTSSD